VRTNWCKLIPEEGHLKKGEVTIQFAILKDGQVTDMHVSSPSGDIALDHAALDGITASNPFKTLPSEFKGNYVALRMHFLYNSPAMTISPTHPEVVSGSVQQFSAAVGSTKNPAVNWSVSGAGCTGDACGTISAEGLYFAPFVVPKPPFITVKAVLTAKPSSIASASVTIVKPDRSQ